ncbi:MAG: NUDIX domain-containing protein [Candidatus Paceibacterota bacterium]
MNEKEDKTTTLCLITRKEGREVLLALKAEGFGKGVWNAFGGKPRAVDGGSVERTLVREVEEESCLRVKPEALKKVAIIRFFFDGEFKWEMHTFLANEWQGEPQSTREMVNPTWFNTAHLPWPEMWEGDPLWMPSVFAGDKVKCDIFYRVLSDGAKIVENVIRYEVDF